MPKEVTERGWRRQHHSSNVSQYGSNGLMWLTVTRPDVGNYTTQNSTAEHELGRILTSANTVHYVKARFSTDLSYSHRPGNMHTHSQVYLTNVVNWILPINCDMTCTWQAQYTSLCSCPCMGGYRGKFSGFKLLTHWSGCCTTENTG